MSTSCGQMNRLVGRKLQPFSRDAQGRPVSITQCEREIREGFERSQARRLARETLNLNTRRTKA